MSTSFTAAAEFYFVRDNTNYLVFPNGWTTPTSDSFDVMNRDTDEYLATIQVSHDEDVDTAFNRWVAEQV